MKEEKEVLPNPIKIRKPVAPPQKVHKDKSKYNRKEKHKKNEEDRTR